MYYYYYKMTSSKYCVVLSEVCGLTCIELVGFARVPIYSDIHSRRKRVKVLDFLFFGTVNQSQNFVIMLKKLIDSTLFSNACASAEFYVPSCREFSLLESILDYFLLLYARSGNANVKYIKTCFLSLRNVSYFC